MKNQRKQEITIGIVVVIATAVLVGLLFLAEGSDWFKSYYRVTVYFEHGGGVTVGTPVKMAGVTIGKVESIEIVNEKEKIDGKEIGQAVKIVILVESARKISQKAIPEIVSASVLGEKFIEFSVGKPDDGFVTHDGKAKINGKTSAAIGDIQKTAAQLLENAEVISERFKRSFDEETVSNLKGTINNIKETSDKIKAASKSFEKIPTMVDKFEKTINNFEDTSENVRKYAKSLEPTINNVNKTIANISDITEKTKKTLEVTVNNDDFHQKFKETVNNIHQVSNKASALVDETRVAIAKTSKNVNDILEASRGKVDKIMTDAQEGVAEARQKINKGLDTVNNTIESMSAKAASLIDDVSNKGLLKYIKSDNVPEMVDEILMRVHSVAKKLERPEDLLKSALVGKKLADEEWKKIKPCQKVLKHIWDLAGKYSKNRKTKKLPDALEDLIDAKYAKKEDLQCPFVGDSCLIGYYWIPGRSLDDDPKTILAFDSKTNHIDLGVRNVLYVDGTIDTISERKFQAIINSCVSKNPGFRKCLEGCKDIELDLKNENEDEQK